MSDEDALLLHSGTIAISPDLSLKDTLTLAPSPSLPLSLPISFSRHMAMKRDIEQET